jgi:hypothetical protein
MCMGLLMVRQVFLVGDDFRSMYGKKRFQGLFDVVSLSVGASHFMADADLSAILSPEGAYVMVENAKCVCFEDCFLAVNDQPSPLIRLHGSHSCCDRYLVPLNKKAKLEYVNKIKDMAKERNWTDDFGKDERQ